MRSADLSWLQNATVPNICCFSFPADLGMSWFANLLFNFENICNFFSSEIWFHLFGTTNKNCTQCWYIIDAKKQNKPTVALLVRFLPACFQHSDKSYPFIAFFSVLPKSWQSSCYINTFFKLITKSSAMQNSWHCNFLIKLLFIHYCSWILSAILSILRT